MTIWQKLPQDIIQRILSYDDRLKLRAGKWMTQIPKTDGRYEILKTIPPKYQYSISPTGDFSAYRETYVIFPNKKYLICRIENDFYFPKDLVLQYFYADRAYVIHAMPPGDLSSRSL